MASPDKPTIILSAFGDPRKDRAIQSIDPLDVWVRVNDGGPYGEFSRPLPYLIRDYLKWGKELGHIR